MYRVVVAVEGVEELSMGLILLEEMATEAEGAEEDCANPLQAASVAAVATRGCPECILIWRLMYARVVTVAREYMEVVEVEVALHGTTQGMHRLIQEELVALVEMVLS